ncbi:Protein bem46 [Neolecta irregularis DAH-3]|uniref:Protein bem46 n=1 Tax=Neolecta irregularis (strain DAH-3) TaxID=1198029 RepID=A0A1U7LM29_NEOID|nr:Protein bem46 [Neolecta irregularis DAH-3]|eukprot:OLL23707.1 Protein bem46 [Neolecta irregularis DAH-3]
MNNWLSYLSNILIMTMKYGGGIFASIFAIASVGLYKYQASLIYMPQFPEGSRTDVWTPDKFGLSYQEVIITTPDNEKLSAYIILQNGTAIAEKRPTGHRIPLAYEFYNKMLCNVFMLSYRGYGKSTGSPDEAGIKTDARAALDFILQHPVLQNTPLIAYGQSLGGAVASYIVAQRQDRFKALILENTFLSIPELIPSAMPLLSPFKFLCNQIWSTVTILPTITTVPILFLSGLRDELVPPSHMKQLHDICQSKKVWHEEPKGDHNTTCMQPGYFSKIREFLRGEFGD